PRYRTVHETCGLHHLWHVRSGLLLCPRASQLLPHPERRGARSSLFLRVPLSGSCRRRRLERRSAVERQGLRLITMARLRDTSSVPLEAAHQLPIRDAAIVLELLPAAGVHVLIDHRAAERFAQQLRPVEAINRLTQRLRHLRNPLADISVT